MVPKQIPGPVPLPYYSNFGLFTQTRSIPSDDLSLLAQAEYRNRWSVKWLLLTATVDKGLVGFAHKRAGQLL